MKVRRGLSSLHGLKMLEIAVLSNLHTYYGQNFSIHDSFSLDHIWTMDQAGIKIEMKRNIIPI